MSAKYTALIQRDGPWWIGWIQEISGVNAQGATREELLDNLQSALQEAIQKADTLIEALGWIRRFRDKITVIKLGGSVLEHESALRHVLLDIVFMETVGMRPVVVHGGGAAMDGPAPRLDAE